MDQVYSIFVLSPLDAEKLPQEIIESCFYLGPTRVVVALNRRLTPEEVRRMVEEAESGGSDGR